MFSSLLAACVAALSVASVNAIPTISAKGSKFFKSDGSQYYIKGIAYQLAFSDPLIDTNQCALDAKLMQQLGANTIRVYHVDSSADHSGCMKVFADAGIYLFVDLDTFSTGIQETDPQWTQFQLSAFQAVMDEFQQYDNVAGMFVGNEVLTEGSTSYAAPFVKAAARDLKAYRDSKGYRDIPIGYSAADISSLRPMLQNYLACGANTSESVDFFGLNAYEWCGVDSSYTISGYDMLEKNATDYPVPIFLSETGCIVPPPRTFEDQSAVLGPEMDSTWSGAIVYEWIWESNHYGLVAYSSSITATNSYPPKTDYIRSGTPTPVQPDFDSLSSQWATLSPTGVNEAAYTPSNTPPACPTYQSPNWLVGGNVALPTLGETYNKGVQASITSAAAPAAAAPSGTGAASASSSPKPGAASGGKEIAGMALGLAGVMLGFIWWL